MSRRTLVTRRGFELDSKPTPQRILSGLVVELDARKASVSGGLITGFGSITQPLTAQQASFSAADALFNNEPVAVFAGTSSADAKWYALPDLSALTQGEAFCVLKCDYSYSSASPPAATRMGLWYLGTGSGSLYNATTAPVGVRDCFGSTARFDYLDAKQVNVPHIYAPNVQTNNYQAYSTLAGAGGSLYSNTGTVTVAFPAAPRFGANSTASGQFNGKLAYLAVCSRVQTPQARAAMLDYLSKRFAIALP